MEQINPEEILDIIKAKALDSGPVEWIAAAGILIIIIY
jgi:hypothetical protein